MKKLGLFAAGVLFGTAGIKLLGCKDAKKVYAHTTAAALRAKEGVMKTVTAVREGAEDVYADAKAINECRAEAEAAAVVEDASAEESKAEYAMKCKILHETTGRLRGHLCGGRRKLSQADVLEYYLLAVDGVRSVKVYDRTQDAVVLYAAERGSIIRALAQISFA